MDILLKLMDLPISISFELYGNGENFKKYTRENRIKRDYLQNL